MKMIRPWLKLLFAAWKMQGRHDGWSWRVVLSMTAMAMMVAQGVWGDGAELDAAARKMVMYRQRGRPNLKAKMKTIQLGRRKELKLVNVKRGTFMMGEDYERHEVTISEDFWIGQCEITCEQYEEIMGVGKNGWLNNEKAKLPQFNVTWEEAKKFCWELTLKCKDRGQLPASGGYYFDLPTEAQWEYAAGGRQYDAQKKFSGSDEVDSVACYGKKSVQKVGEKEPNELGIYDMSGNVGEWCLDVYYDEYPTETVDPIATKNWKTFGNPFEKPKYVVRGGSYDSSPDDCRIVARYFASDSSYTTGFRVVLVREKDIEKKKDSEKQNIEILEQVGEGDLKNAWNSTVRNRKNLPKFSNDKDEGTEMVVVLAEKVELKLKRIPAGQFTNAEIRRTFELKRDYWLGETEVTQAQYLAVMGNNPSYFKGDDSCPVENVTWNEAMSFCRKLTERERDAGRLPAGFEYSLPTEAQWEFAARGNESDGCKYSGGNSLKNCGYYYENSGDKTLYDAEWDSSLEIDVKMKKISKNMADNRNRTHPVAGKNKNSFGLYDMSGNVWELCRDVYDREWDYDPETLARMKDGPERVRRGGSWGCNAKDCRVSKRSYVDSPDKSRGNDIGFRVALVPVQ